MPLSTTSKNGMLDSRTFDRMRLHSGDPGASGTSNALGSLTACTFAAASSSSRALSSAVDFTGLGAGQSVTHVSVWNNNGGSPIFEASGQITSGDVSANAAGEYRVATPTTISIT